MSKLLRILVPPVAAFVFFGVLGLMVLFLSPGWALLGAIVWVTLAISVLVEVEP